MQTQQRKVRNVKLVLLGASSVGKSSLVMRFANDRFRPDSQATIGASFLMKTIALEDGTGVSYSLWDTAGQEKYRTLAPMYYRGAEVAVVCYDITSEESFATLREWVLELRTHGPPSIVIGIAGNKCDLEAGRAIDTHRGSSYAASLEAEGVVAVFAETSAKDGTGVNELFRMITQALPDPAPEHTRTQSVIVRPVNPEEAARKGCACEGSQGKK